MAGTIDLPSPTDGERRASPGSAWLDPPRWAYDVPGSRDRRLDFLRGFLVAAMVVDHVGGEFLLTRLSGNNAFLVSAAEGFVFISGLLMGIVYGGRMTKLGLRAGMEGVLRRVGRLHITIALLTFTFVLIYLYRTFGEQANLLSTTGVHLLVLATLLLFVLAWGRLAGRVEQGIVKRGRALVAGRLAQ